MKILAIDPGTNFGYAAFDNAQLFDWGDLEAFKKNYSEESTSHLSALIFLFQIINPDVVVVEDVVKAASRMKSWQAIWFTVGVQFMVEQLCSERSVPLVSVGPTKLKSFLMNECGAEADVKATKSGQQRKALSKGGVINFVNGKYGLKLRAKHHNAADAIALALYGFTNQQIN